MKRWCPGMKLTKAKLENIRLWFRLYNVRLDLRTKDVMGYLDNIIGNYLYADEQTWLKNRLNYARLCIKVPTGKEILKFIIISLGYCNPFE